MQVETRPFGPKDPPVSRLGFGCGAVGGLMVRGAAADRDRAIGRALEGGIKYFDTTVAYGDGASERHPGSVLHTLGVHHAIVGIRMRLHPAEFGRIAEAATKSLEGSLRRLQRDCVDVFHLHNPITLDGGGESLSVRQVLEEVVPAFQALRDADKVGLAGLTAIGETEAMQRVVDAGAFGSAQVVYNMLNRSVGGALPDSASAQDYGHLFERIQRTRTGVVGIRVLAVGALSGSTRRHPVASPAPAPIGSALSYDEDVRLASRLMPPVTEGFAASLPEAATRFAVAEPAIGTVLVGMASVNEFEGALAAVLKEPLPAEALRRVAELTAGGAR